MKSTLRDNRTVIALAVGIIIGMLVPMASTRAQTPFGTRTPFGVQAQAPPDPNDCEQYYRALINLRNTGPENTNQQALLYLA